MIEKGYKANLATIKKAAANNDLALMECKDAHTGKRVIALCAIAFDGKEYITTPLAKMFDGNPYEELIPPTVEKE